MVKIRLEISSLASARPSGVANYTKLLASALAPTNEVRGSYFSFLTRQPIPIVNPLVTKESCAWFPLRIYAKLNSHGLAFPFDFYKSRVDLTIHPNFARWPTVRSRYVMVVIHDLTYLYYPEVVEINNLAHLRRVVPRAIKQSDAIITVSNAVKSEIVKEFRIEENRVVVTEIPPAPEFFLRSDRDVHAHYNIPTHDYLLFVGNLEPRKNLATLIKAYRLLPPEVREQYSLVIAGGKGWKFESTQALIDEPLDAGHICQIGFVDQVDLPALFQKSSLFVMASLYEGFGMPITEALASGCRVVAADIPVLRESGGEAIIYADPLNPQDFADKITTALAMPFDKAAADAQLAKFSWANNTQRILDAYKRLTR